MSEQEGISRVVSIARQAVFNQRAAKGAYATILDRVENQIQVSKDLLTNDTKRPSGQSRPDRHGMRRVAGDLTAVFQPKNFAPFLASVLRTDFETAKKITASLTFDAGANTITRAAGSFVADGVVNGDTILVGGVTTSDNFFYATVTNVAALVLTVDDVPITDAVANPNAYVIVSGQTQPKKVTTAAGDGYTVVAAAKTITRGAGGGQSFLVDGLKIGEVINLPDGAVANQGKNFTLIDVTATTLVVSETISDDAGPNNSGQLITVPGGVATFQKTLAAKQKPFWTIEDRHPAMTVPESIVEHGIVFGAASLDLTPTDIYDLTLTTIGKDFAKLIASDTPAGAPYFTNERSMDSLIEAFGGIDLKVIVNGVSYCEVTSFSLELNNNVTGIDAFCRDDHATQGGVAKVSYGRFTAAGSFTVILEAGAFFDFFDDETLVPITLFFQSANRDAARGNAPEFVSVHFPHCKINGYSTDDPDGPVIVTCAWTAYERVDATLPSKYAQTTAFMQDSTQ